MPDEDVLELVATDGLDPPAPARTSTSSILARKSSMAAPYDCLRALTLVSFCSASLRDRSAWTRSTASRGISRVLSSKTSLEGVCMPLARELNRDEGRWWWWWWLPLPVEPDAPDDLRALSMSVGRSAVIEDGESVVATRRSRTVLPAVLLGPLEVRAREEEDEAR